jgi:hypothetical protein
MAVVSIGTLDLESRTDVRCPLALNGGTSVLAVRFCCLSGNSLVSFQFPASLDGLARLVKATGRWVCIRRCALPSLATPGNGCMLGTFTGAWEVRR